MEAAVAAAAPATVLAAVAAAAVDDDALLGPTAAPPAAPVAPATAPAAPGLQFPLWRVAVTPFAAADAAAPDVPAPVAEAATHSILDLFAGGKGPWPCDPLDGFVIVVIVAWAAR